jgi:hypothetical protein
MGLCICVAPQRPTWSSGQELFRILASSKSRLGGLRLWWVAGEMERKGTRMEKKSPPTVVKEVEEFGKCGD